jgi:hypothetical protein
MQREALFLARRAARMLERESSVYYAGLVWARNNLPISQGCVLPLNALEHEVLRRPFLHDVLVSHSCVLLVVGLQRVEFIKKVTPRASVSLL